MSDQYVQLPSESGNTGKKVSYVQKTINSETVVIPRTVNERYGEVAGVFRLTSTLQSVSVAAQNGTSTGFFWLVNDAGNTKTIRIRRLSLQYNFIGVTTLTTLPRMVIQRFTKSGTPSGAQTLGVNIDGASVVAAVADLRTAVTGMTVSLTANTVLAASLPPQGQVSGTAAVFETTATYNFEMLDAESVEDQWITIPPGQGIVMWQADAGGATTDTRRFVYNLVWDEIS